MGAHGAPWSRGFAAEPSPEAVAEFARARAAHRRELGKLRATWAKEAASKAASESSSAEQEREARAAAAAERVAARKAAKAAKEAKAAARGEEERAAKAARQAAAAEREAVRRESIALARSAQYEELLSASRFWITEEKLDERIALALDSPTEIYSGYDVLYEYLANHYPHLYGIVDADDRDGGFSVSDDEDDVRVTKRTRVNKN